jgi:hypothetical protein
VDVLIGRRGKLRAFAGRDTCASEAAAIAACWTLGRRLIDQSPRDCAVDQLPDE